MKRRLFVAGVLSALNLPSWAAERLTPLSQTLRAAVSSELAKADEQIDLLHWKFRVDDLSGIPAAEADSAQRDFLKLQSSLAGMMPPNAPPMQKLQILRKFLYAAGPWNDMRPFSYDKTDPLGRSLPSKLLGNYIQTRKGNCVSMPLMFYFLGKSVDLDLRMMRAPEHILLQFKDLDGKTYNIESTSGGGFVRDEWVAKNLPMTELSRSSGLYMWPLTNKQAAVLIAQLLLESLSQQGEHFAQSELASLMLRHDPTNADVMLHSSYAYSKMADNLKKNPKSTSDIGYQVRIGLLQQESQRWQYQATKLGWEEIPQ